MGDATVQMAAGDLIYVLDHSLFRFSQNELFLLLVRAFAAPRFFSSSALSCITAVNSRLQSVGLLRTAERLGCFKCSIYVTLTCNLYQQYKFRERVRSPARSAKTANRSGQFRARKFRSHAFFKCALPVWSAPQRAARQFRCVHVFYVPAMSKCLPRPRPRARRAC